MLMAAAIMMRNKKQVCVTLRKVTHAFAMNAKVKQSFCIPMQQKDPVWQAFCICKLWYAAN